MANKRYADAPMVRLEDYMPAACFRTVLAEQREVPGGISEIPVEIVLGKQAVRLLRFPVPWDGVLYGFLRGKRILQERLQTAYVPTGITVSDWDNYCVLVIETTDPKTEMALRVSTNEVLLLLENCRRVPEQRNRKTDKER